MEKYGNTTSKIKIALVTIIIVLSFSNVYVYSASFIDMDNHWSGEYVKFLSDEKIINGYPDNTFKPENNVTIGETLKLVIAKYYVADNTFKEHWAEKYLEYAQDNGIVKKGVYTVEQLDRPAMRKEVMYIIANAIEKLGFKPAIKVDETMPIPFNDVTKDINENEEGVNYFNAIQTCYYSGIVIGDDLGNMKPNTTITRAEISTMITRAYYEYKRTYSNNVKVDALPSNGEEYRKVLSYMPNEFYEDSQKEGMKYVGGMTPYFYLKEGRIDSTDTATNDVRSSAQIILNNILNVSYKMSDEQWNRWMDRILIAKDVTIEQLYEYKEYVISNEIEIRGGAILNPETVGYMFINEELGEYQLGIRGYVHYKIVSNPKKVNLLTIDEYISNKQKINNNAKYIIMYLNEKDMTDYYTLYNLEYLISNLKYIEE